uniref:BLVR domain-containing protein n=1 Tax=Strongyloides stercoralis TaxID=6248 RepID=A0A0K0E2Q2_STRER
MEKGSHDKFSEKKKTFKHIRKVKSIPHIFLKEKNLLKNDVKQNNSEKDEYGPKLNGFLNKQELKQSNKVVLIKKSTLTNDSNKKVPLLKKYVNVLNNSIIKHKEVNGKNAAISQFSNIKTENKITSAMEGKSRKKIVKKTVDEDNKNNDSSCSRNNDFEADNASYARLDVIQDTK